MTPIFRYIALIFILAATSAGAQSQIPSELQEWQDWVLKDREYRNCAFDFNSSASSPAEFRCTWPGRLDITASTSGASFMQSWTVYAKEQWVRLPGDAEYWPDGVTVNDRNAVVVARDGLPSVRLSPGTWRVAGSFEWDERPSALRVPPESGLLSLTVNGQPVARPDVNRDRVFLGERKIDTRARNAVRSTLHRLVMDDVPTRLVTQLRIDVSGSVREEEFGPFLPEGFIPLALHSDLPAKLESDGKLRVQVRPGRWTIRLTARGASVTDAIVLQAAGSNTPDSEIWSYRANDQLRVSAVEGLAPVDPRQVEVPNGWQNLPAYRLGPGGQFNVVERSRGIVSAANELALSRTLWLDFDGSGFVVQDRIGGLMRSDWRLNMTGPYSLLSATEYDENLLITNDAKDGRSGIEVRHSQVGIETIGRSDARGEMPASGWDERFTSLNATLNLPPGHKLIAAPGVDEAGGSWMSQWQLLDFFLLLILTIAVWKLFGRSAGVIALLAMTLALHEIGPQIWLWLNLVVAIALIRVAPEGRLKKAVFSYQAISAAALLLFLLPFVASELRLAIYPQLEDQADRYGSGVTSPVPAVMGFTDDESDGNAQHLMLDTLERAERKQSDSFADVGVSAAIEEAVVTASKSRRFSRYAPNAIVQAGPGIPSWRWNSVALNWSGPVDADQTMHLVIMPRWLVGLLRCLEVALLLLFAAVLAAEITKRSINLPGGLKFGGGKAAAVLLCGALALSTAAPQANAEVPDAEILSELQNRLLEPPQCAPRCAEIVSADVQIGSDQIAMNLTIHAIENVSIPLPGSAIGWRPDAISVNGSAAALIRRAPDGTLWLRATAGRHSVVLRGPIPAVDTLEVPFHTPPRVARIESDGWFVAGVKDRRLLSGSLQLTRLQADAGDGSGVRWESSRFPVFARIERVVELDLDWQVRTTVHRVAPAQGALTLDVPLLNGEAIVSGEFTVNDGRVLVSMNPQQQSVTWTSDLPLVSPLALQAEAGSSWQEVWQFAVGNIWNAEFSGLPESNTGWGADSVRVAAFHPRAGEELLMTATRPEASAGSSLAFDAVSLAVAYGDRSRESVLNMDYRSTRGSQHVFQLPSDAEVTNVWIDGQEQTQRAKDGALTLPILPGSHKIAVTWRETGAMDLRTATPAIDIGAPASNIQIAVTKPRDRWLLATVGPDLGPAVLYWSELAVLVIFAIILGRVGIGPLNTLQWLLLGLGFSTFSWPVLFLVAVWILVCGVREKVPADDNWQRFNVMQVAIGALSVLALFNIVATLPLGLLGVPDMHVAGHNSFGNTLTWFADGSESSLPLASVFTVPMWIYKGLILAWALWFSFALLRWLPWVWQCFSRDGFWHSKKRIEAQ